MMFVEVAFLITKTRLHNNSGVLNMPLKSVKLATMNESRLRIKLQPSEVPSVNFLREKVSRRLDSESLDPFLGMIALCYWVFSPSETRFTVIPLVFALVSLTLLVKGVFLLRNSSEGLGLSVFRNRNSPSSPTLHWCLTPLATSHPR
jgi:hypothetical protein